MRKITNTDNEDIMEKPETELDHELKIAAKAFLRVCEKNNVPVFLSYYTQKKGYSYHGLFPEELEDESLSSQYGRFPKFLEIVVGFNKEDYKPVISKNKDVPMRQEFYDDSNFSDD